MAETGFNIRFASTKPGCRPSTIASTMAGSLRRAFAPFEEAPVRDALSRHERVILAYSELHRCLTVGRVAEGAPIDDYLRRLGAALEGAILAPLGHNLTVSFERGYIPAFAPERLGLIIAELVMNAAKHAFADKIGNISLTLRKEPDGKWVCTVSDNGVGLTASSRGTGSQIIDTLVSAISGEMIVASSSGGTTGAIVLASGL